MQKFHWFIIAVLALMMFVLRSPFAVGAMPHEGLPAVGAYGKVLLEGGPSYEIGGRITENGANLANITVRLAFSNNPDKTIQIATTGADGRYTFTNLPINNYVIRPDNPAYNFVPPSRSANTLQGSVYTVDFTAIFREYDVDGRVIGSDGVPLEDITVRLFRLPNTTTPIQNLLTDAQGRYLFPDVIPGNYRITPQSSAYTFEPTFVEFSVVNDPITLSDFQGNLITYDLSGRVRDNGSGLGNVIVTLATMANPETILQWATTNGNGDYDFDDIVPNTYRVTPTLEDYLFVPDYRDVPVTNGNVTEVDFEANINIFNASGRITNGGAPFVQVEVFLSTQQNPNTPIASTFTNSNGEYTFFALTPGDYRVFPVRTGYGFNPPDRNFTIVNANVPGLDFTATRLTYSASGRIEHDGMALEGVTVTLSISNTGEVLQEDLTDANGDYRFSALAPSEFDYLVTPSLPPYGFIPPAQNFIISNANVSNLDFEAVIQYLYLPLTQRATAAPPPTPTPSPTAIPCLVEINPNDNLADAESNPAFAPDRCILGALPSPDINDFYKIEAENGAFRASLTGIAEGTDYDLTLYEVVGGEAVLVEVSNNPGSQNETINLSTLDAGVYYIGVQSFEGNSLVNYNLRWTQP
jgi:hypothetical protein